MAGVLALILVASSHDVAPAGPVHSPFTKAQAREARIELYEHELALRDANPSGVRLHTHPLLGSVLSGEAGFDKFLAKHQFHHGLLCEHDPFIWRVVEGDILYHKLHPFSNPSPPSVGGPAAVVDSLPTM